MTLFKGAATALITPFKDGKIDYVSMGKLIEWQISQGIDAREFDSCISKKPL